MKKWMAIGFCILLLFSLTSCGLGEVAVEEETDVKENYTSAEGVLSIEDYMKSLSAKKTEHLKPQTDLLLHPLKEAVERYGNKYTMTWEGNYVTLTYSDAKVSFDAMIGMEFDSDNPYCTQEDFEYYNSMEYLSYAVIERVRYDVKGATLTDGIAIGMTVSEITEIMGVSGINYQESNTYIMQETDENGKKVDVYYVSSQLPNNIDYVVVFKGDVLASVEIANYNRYVTDETTDGDNGKQILGQAIAYVTEKKLGTFEAEAGLVYKGSLYSSHYDSWFYGWKLEGGKYDGYEINVEKTAPHRVYMVSATGSVPILFWADGKYVDPVLSFLGKWRVTNSLEYIDVKSISKEGLVVFDMYIETPKQKKMHLIANLSTAINEMPASLDACLANEYMDEALDGDTQLFDGEVQSGYYTYGTVRYCYIDSLCLDWNGQVIHYARSMTNRVGASGVLHIPDRIYDYNQDATWGYMENFGRDDQNPENVISTAAAAGDAVLNAYKNDLHSTSGLNYAKLEYKYLHDYLFPVNDTTYHVWEALDTEDPHYLYVDATTNTIIKEYTFNTISKHRKDLIYKGGSSVSTKSYINQKYTTSDGKIQVDLENDFIGKTDSFVPEIAIEDIIYDEVDGKEKFIFFSNIGDRYALNGYVLFDHSTWGATLHITDSNIPGFEIGLYYLNSETFFLDPSIGVMAVPEKTEQDKYLEDQMEDMEKDSKIVIREFSGKVIGYIYLESNGDKTVKDFYGRILGYYRASRNVTTDFYGKILAQGDISSALLFM